MQMNHLTIQQHGPFATATNFTRVFVGRYSGGTYNMAFEDGMSGYGLYINTASNRIDSYYSYGTGTGRGVNRTNNTSSYTHGNPFIYSTYLDTDERNYTNADKAFYERNGVEYNHGSVGSVLSPKDSLGWNNNGVLDGMMIGNYRANPASYAWNGDISEIIYFDEALTSVEREALNEWLMRKYGQVKTCTLPAVTTWL